MDIREIAPIDINVKIRELDIPPIDIWTAPAVGNTNVSIPPVTVELGTPIVNIPGCVEAHESNNDSKTVGTDDENGLITYCDAGVPSFNPIDYDKNQLKFTKDSRPTPQFKGEQPNNLEDDTPESAVGRTPEDTSNIQCPTQEQLDKEPVGFLFDSGRKEILGYKLVGNQCVREVGDVPIITQVLNGLPPTGVVITTGGIAVVATTSALLAKPFADILLKVIKPTVKKVLKKVAAIRGKKLKVQSVEDRRVEQRDRNQAIAKLKSVKAKTKK